MGYVSFNSGFKSGGFNNPATIAPFKPEKLYAYETGLKLNLLDDRLRVNTAAFYYNYKDTQVQFFQQSQVAYYNAKGAKLYGLDGDLQALVAPGLSVTVGVSLLKDYFSDFPNAVVYTPVAVLGRTGPSFLTTGSATDNQLPLAPRATFNLSADYRHALAYGIGSVDVAYQRSSNYAFTPDNAFQQPPFNVLNASLSWSTPDDRFTVTLWGKNLTNDLVANFITETGSVMLAQYKPPRTYGVTVGARF
jgi:iron complex outermembrane receptor protein